MSAILDALNNLNQSLDRLDTAASEVAEQNILRVNQQEMFNGTANGAVNGNHGADSIDPAILAGKLDITIERIEEILREG